MRICRDYRRSVAPAPYLMMTTDMPAPAVLVVDRSNREVYICTLREGCGNPEPDPLTDDPMVRTYPWDPCLTVRGIDAVLEHPDVLQALMRSMQGDTESHHYLLEVLGSPDFFVPYTRLQVLEPYEYLDGRTHRLRDESVKDAAQRICREALGDLVWLDTLAVERHLEYLEEEDLEEES